MKQERKPNSQLRRERLLRGWSQKRLADHLDTSKETVSRWECGFQDVSPYFQEKLCSLFNKDAVELGFVKEQSQLVDLSEAFLSRLEKTLTLPHIHQQFPKVPSFLAQPIMQIIITILKDLDGNNVDTLRRKILQRAAELTGMCLLPHATLNIVPEWIQTNHIISDKPDFDLIDDYTRTLYRLFTKGEAIFVLNQAQNLYKQIAHNNQFQSNTRSAETCARLGMLIGSAQEYVLPWYQRDQAVLQTYNHLEQSIFQVHPLLGSLHLMYLNLLAKRGRYYRVLWQFDAGIKTCEDGLVYVQSGEHPELLTHFLCERAHIEATKGNEHSWLQKLEEARNRVLGLASEERKRALNQVDYMQGEGFKRLAFHSLKGFSLPLREKYANFAISHLRQWNGMSIEIAGFESFVSQISKAQCLILTDPHEALSLASQVRKQVEQDYPALLDKIRRIEMLAHHRLQTSGNAFLQSFQTSVYRTGKNTI